jgi:hypothetical protein
LKGGYIFDFEETFDGVWANASLLHIPRNEIKKSQDVIPERDTLWLYASVRKAK